MLAGCVWENVVTAGIGRALDVDPGVEASQTIENAAAV
jgi:hypothetical protein